MLGEAERIRKLHLEIRRIQDELMQSELHSEVLRDRLEDLRDDLQQILAERRRRLWEAKSRRRSLLL